MIIAVAREEPRTRFLLDRRSKAARFRLGSASGSGDWPGLQNRWRALRGVLGGFDSHALPPLIPEREPGVTPSAQLRQARRLVPSQSVLCRHVPLVSGTSAAHGTAMTESPRER